MNQGDEGMEVMQVYHQKYFDLLAAQSKFLVKFPLEGGKLTMKAVSTCQQEDGIHYIVSCYWRSTCFRFAK